MNTAPIDCLGIILAGGQSSRMGENKAQLTLNDSTMLEHCQQLLKHCHLQNIVVSGENNGGVADLVNEGGPLAGIYSIIKKYNPKSILVLPIDMPFIHHKHLLELKLKGSLSARSAHYNDSSLPAFIPVNAFLTDFLQQQFTSDNFVATNRGPSFKQVFKMTNALTLTIDDKQALFNTNTPEQWQQAIKLTQQNFKKGNL